MSHLNRAALLTVAITASLGLAACATTTTSSTNPGSDSPAASGGAAASGQKLDIVATTGYLGDAVANIAPDANLTVLVKPGGDPHTQALTTKDSERIQNADLVVWTSHDMEHQMMAALDKLGERQLAAAEGDDIKPLLLPWEEDGKIEGNDPHVWNSPDIWMKVVDHIGTKLGELDPANAATYKANAATYNAKIKAAKDEAGALLSQIPAERRVLITGHDAFNYLGKTFDIEIHATDFVSSEAELSPTQLNELATLIATKQIPVIFQDNLQNPQAINNLQQAVAAHGWQVQVSDHELYADSLGTTAPTDTYLGAFKYNAEVISEALTHGK